jgi:3-phosphoshikimate 1-carboxyvinyltransferase
MQRVCITPSPLRGMISPPPSKSAAHRAMICAALASGGSEVFCNAFSDDITATLGVLRALGTDISVSRDSVRFGERSRAADGAVLDCGESGSTLRFLIPVAAAIGGRFIFTGRGRLPQRPLGPYLTELPKHGVTLEGGGLPLTVSGQLKSGSYFLPGNISSQFITGLLLALPLLDGDSVITLTSPLESAGYVALTLGIMKRFGVAAEPFDGGWKIRGGQKYLADRIKVEGDWSQAAFWLCAGALGGPIDCAGLDPASFQGDKAVVSILRRFGAVSALTEDGARVHSGKLGGIEIDASQIPDIVPVLAATACFARGTTLIFNAARLRAKESDRLATTCAGLSALGAKIESGDDRLIINSSSMCGGRTESFGDHRIAMALSIAAAYCAGPSEIDGCECVAKSYPNFYDDFKMLGGHADVVNLG